MATEGWGEKDSQPGPAHSGYSRLPMEKKVWLGFAAALALLLFVGLTAYFEVVKLRNNERMVDHTHQVISSLRRVQSLVADAETGQRGYLITGNALFLQPYNAASSDLHGELSTLRTLTSDNPKQQESRRELERLTAKRLEQLHHVLALKEIKGTPAAAEEILSLDGMRTDNAIREVVGLMEEREDRQLAEREQTSLQTSQSSRSIIVLGSVMAFCFVGGALLLIARVILRDVAEGKKAEAELKQQASLLDLAPVVVRDMENRIVLWSRGAEKIYGYAKEEALGRNSHELLQAEHPIPLWMIDRVLRTSGVWEGELHHRTRDGGLVYVATQWVLYRDAHGIPVRILEVNADITARRHAEELQTRSQKLEALGTLAGGIAHDFNNILLAINGNAQLAMSDVPPGNLAGQSIAEILKAGARATDLVKRILGFSRPQEQRKQVVKLQPVIEEAMKLMRATLPARIRFVTSFSADVPPAKVDPGQIHQVMVNLATNAAHAIGERNGTIEIRLDVVDVSADDRQAAGKLEEGKYLRLFVSDDGCGMDRTTLNRIFDPFFTTKKLGEGTGLGLSVVHGIVTSHGGAIAVTSQPEEGTAFHLYFPIAIEALEAVADAPKEFSQNRSEHIMYVDDEESLVFLATRLLERRGYRVSGFTNAITALKQFRENPTDIDAVVTDLSMPGMSGFELTEEIHRTRADIPILLTSGYLQAEDQQKAESLGIRETIQKPATADKLAGALEKILSEQPAKMHVTGKRI